MSHHKKTARKTMSVHDIQLIIGADPRLDRAFKAMSGRGLSKAAAEAEISMALFSFMHDVANGHPGRLTYVMKKLEEGKTMTEIFPKGAFEGDFPGTPPFRVKDDDGVDMTGKNETTSGPLSVETLKELLRRSKDEGTDIFELLQQFTKAYVAPGTDRD